MLRTLPISGPMVRRSKCHLDFCVVDGTAHASGQTAVQLRSRARTSVANWVGLNLCRKDYRSQCRFFASRVFQRKSASAFRTVVWINSAAKTAKEGASITSELTDGNNSGGEEKLKEALRALNRVTMKQEMRNHLVVLGLILCHAASLLE